MQLYESSRDGPNDEKASVSLHETFNWSVRLPRGMWLLLLHLGLALDITERLRTVTFGFNEISNLT